MKNFIFNSKKFLANTNTLVMLKMFFMLTIFFVYLCNNDLNASEEIPLFTERQTTGATFYRWCSSAVNKQLRDAGRFTRKNVQFYCHNNAVLGGAGLCLSSRLDSEQFGDDLLEVHIPSVFCKEPYLTPHPTMYSWVKLNVPRMLREYSIEQIGVTFHPFTGQNMTREEVEHYLPSQYHRHPSDCFLLRSLTDIFNGPIKDITKIQKLLIPYANRTYQMRGNSCLEIAEDGYTVIGMVSKKFCK